MDNNDYMQMPTDPPAPTIGPDAYGADKMATWRLALLITGWAGTRPDLDAVSDRDRGYVLALAHALRAVRNDYIDNGEEGEDTRYEVDRAIEAARVICASFDAWVDAGQPTA